MGEKVQFHSDGHSCDGYRAVPPSGSGPAVVVIQEWWGVVPHIEQLVDRFATAGFLAITPDLYHGQIARSPDEAGKLLMELDVERAAAEISGAASHLLSLPQCTSKTFGVVGFCMGGALAQYSATKDHRVSAAVSFYGGFRKVQFDWTSLSAPMLLLFGENDPSVPPSSGIELQKTLQAMGKSVEVVSYEGAGHAFFNDTRPEAFNAVAADDSWQRTLALFRQFVR